MLLATLCVGHLSAAVAHHILWLKLHTVLIAKALLTDLRPNHRLVCVSVHDLRSAI